MHIGKRDRFATPKTSPMLAIILPLRLFISKKAFGSTPTVIGDTLLASITFRVFGVIFLAFMWIKAMEFTLRLCHFCSVFTMIIKATSPGQFKVIHPVALHFSSFLIGISFRPLALIFAGANFTP